MKEKELQEVVRNLMYANLKKGYSKLLHKHYCFIQPSPHKYPYQWFWDTFFHIYILCALEEYELAKLNMETLFSRQQEDGFVGHMIYWKGLLPQSFWQILESRPTLKQFRPHMSALIQPTFGAQCLERIYQDTHHKGFVKAMLPKIIRYHKWLTVNRCYEDNNLIFIIAPMESGLDEKPSYDPLVGSHPKKGSFKQYLQLMSIEAKNFFSRYQLPKIYKADRFIVKDVAMNTIYALDLFALGRLCQQHGDSIEGLYFENLAHKVCASIRKLMYNEEDDAFYDLGGRKNKQLKGLTFSIFFPLALPNISDTVARKVMRRHFANKEEFNLQYPIPSVAGTEKAFNAVEARSPFFDFLWRGPTWAMVNWFLYQTFLQRGYETQAEQLFNSLEALINTSGFREYYDPITGKGYGAKNFTWSGLVVDMMRIRDHKKTLKAV